MRVLVVTDVLWRDDNGVGNSYSNIFKGLEGVTFANICCQMGKSDNEVSSNCFQISEGSLLSNLKNKKNPTGKVEDKSEEQSANSKPSKLSLFVKRTRLQIFFWLRNFIWKIGRWKSQELDKFIQDFNPDLIFAQLQDKVYLNNLVRYVVKKTQKPLCLYAWDDVYSLKQFSLSPLYWIDRFMQRRSIRKVVKKSKILYTICEEQRVEYAKTLKANTKLLYKGYDFEEVNSKECSVNPPITILYTGNLYSGRYKTLKKICNNLKEFNKEKEIANLSIYSATPLTEKQIKKINIEGCSKFLGKTTEKHVQELQKEADVLLHIEPFNLKGRLLCRLSFSTKLVDYFYNGKCIFAVGSKVCSSMKYLERNDSCLTVTNLKNLKDDMERLLNDEELIKCYSKKSFETGKKNHQIKEIQKGLLEDFNQLTKE